MVAFLTAPRFDWDIFCRVVDNFGDIGVTWRLARGLAADHGCRVRLWVDDWDALATLCPAAAGAGEFVCLEGVELHRWRAEFPVVVPAAGVVEAFACELPETFVAAMAACTPVPRWINLEYLSAEAWVEDCHCMLSPHPRLALTKHFWFPGFTPATGGLLREAGLLAARRDFLADTGGQTAWLQRLGVPPMPPDTRRISLFAYEQPALADLLATWAAGPRPTLLLVPESRVTPDVLRSMGAPEADGVCRRGALTVVRLPFLAPADYDRLLWSCDLNFVRGEDSFVRAQWAARPFVWHIYEQDEAAHHAKLEAFLDRLLAGTEAGLAQSVRAFWSAWNGQGDLAVTWAAFDAHLPQFAEHAQHWCDGLAAQPDLATALVQFSELAVR